MSANELYELAGRIEGVGRMVMCLVDKLDDLDLLDGEAFSAALRCSVVVEDADPLMAAAERTLFKAADFLDETRQWRAFRRALVGPAPGRRHG